MKVLNYTGLKKRDKTLYTVAGVDIPGGGVSVKLLATVGVCEVIFNIIGIAISKSAGIPYVDLSTGKSYMAMFFIMFPAVVGFMINKVKIKGHDLHIYVYYALKFSFSKKYKDIDGNQCDDCKVMYELYMDENQ